MGIPQYLAMTTLELHKNQPPEHTAYMSCHFSSYQPGLSNLPSSLPPGALLLLDDSTAVTDHDPELVAWQLKQLLEEQKSFGILLDFQREKTSPSEAMIRHLLSRLSCPIAVTAAYAQALDCPAFLPPVPLHVPLEEHFMPWKGRCIWQEVSLGGERLTLTEAGCESVPYYGSPEDSPVFTDRALHCHYCMSTEADSVRFTLWRTKEDVTTLIHSMEDHNVTLTVGLWQELGG